MKDVIPADPRKQLDITTKWSHLADFSRADRPDEPGVWNLIYSLRSIEEVCHVLLEKEFPKLMSAADGDSLRGALLDIELHLRHLVYHARDTRYFLDVDLNWTTREELELDHQDGPSR